MSLLEFEVTLLLAQAIERINWVSRGFDIAIACHI